MIKKYLRKEWEKKTNFNDKHLQPSNGKQYKKQASMRIKFTINYFKLIFKMDTPKKTAFSAMLLGTETEINRKLRKLSTICLFSGFDNVCIAELALFNSTSIETK